MPRIKEPAHESSPRGIFVTATDTDVGKTLVTSALAMCLTRWGIDVGVMKPIETGVSRQTKAQSDGVRLRSAAECQDPMEDISPYVFRHPVAPLSAARMEGRAVHIATILRAFRSLNKKHLLMLVEGAGGVHVPISSSLGILDLIYQMKLKAIVVGQSSLGGINHALLTLDALRHRNISILALVLNQVRPLRTKTARAQEQSTVHLLRRLAKVPVVGPLPYSPNVSRNWDEGLIRLAKTAPIIRLASLVLASGRGTRVSPD
jgi:dethiobiotin synthetase